MLTALARASALGALLALTAACEQQSDTPAPLSSVEAGYRLLFNDALVGNAFFALEVEPDGGYRIDALTVPAGQLQKAADHEVLEFSSGRLENGRILPQRFVHSVMQNQQIEEVVSLRFDWPQRALYLRNADQERRASLLPDTYDRLSYLLMAYRLAARAGGLQQIQIASAEATEAAVLEITGKSRIEVPLGTYQATGVRRVSALPGETRMLWFDVTASPLPLRIVRQWDSNTVDMQLETFSRPRSDPR
jgi:hypothetical protein